MAGTRKHIATSIVQGDHVHRLLPMLDERGVVFITDDILGQGVTAIRPRTAGLSLMRHF